MKFSRLLIALALMCALTVSPVFAEEGGQSIGGGLTGASSETTGETVTLGVHEMIVPADWTVEQTDESVIMFSSGENIVGLYTYALTEDVIAQYKAAAYDDVAATLQESAVTGLSTAGFDTENAVFVTYELNNGMPIVTADTDASALGEGWRTTTAIFLTDVDMGMCMIFYTGDDYEQVTTLMWQAVDMYFGEQMSPAQETTEAAAETTVETVPAASTGNEAAALEEAKSMIEYGAYSRDLLVHMLTEYDGYTAAEAEYAADNCGADWAQEAAEAVQGYSTYGMSRDYMVHWLTEYDYFSTELAETAVDNSGIDWNEQALTAAAESLEGYGESYAGMIEDMTEYQLFTLEQATYAADNCGADWNQQALQVASHHLDGTSYDGMIELLENIVGFTHDEAVYAADNCGADWFEQAYIKAKFLYDNDIVTSRDDIISNLEYSDFTSEQAVYAVDTLGL